jgi:hypothetical protein
MPEPEKAMILCVRVGEVDDIAPGSHMFIADCGCECWIAPGSQQMLAEHPERVMTSCSACVMQDPEKRKELVESLSQLGLNMTPRQRQEMNNWIGVSETDQMMAMFGIKEKDLPK